MSQNLDEQFYRILQKCATHPEFASASLEEGSIKHLIVEEIDKADVESVRKVADTAKNSLKKLRSYMDQLQLQTELQPLYDYTTALEGALDKTSKELANVSFDSGVLSGFFGKKLTLPQITSAAIKLNTKAVDFGRGFLNSMEKIRKDLAPILKDADPEQTLADAVGADPTVDLKKVSKGLEDELTKSFGGTLFKKVKGFFSQALTGKEAKIMSSDPMLNADMKALAKTTADALVNAKIENLLGKAPPKPPPEETITDLEDEMKDVAADDDAKAPETEKSEGEPEAAATEEEAAGSQKEAGSELENAVKDAVSDSESPKDAAFDALTNWVNSLSPTSQKSLQTKNRIGDLKDMIGMALDDSAKAIEGEVSAAIQAWRDDHEETLVRSKRFAKNNFDSLEKLIPQLASAMMKKAAESRKDLRRSHVRRFVFSYLDRYVQNRLDEQNMGRWQKMAGLLND